MSNLPAPARQPLPPSEIRSTLTRAAVSPAAAIATAAGAGIGALDHSVTVAVVLAVCGWAGRMGAALGRLVYRRRSARPRPVQVDPWSVPPPWRSVLERVAAAQDRLDAAVAGWPSGPLRDRMTGLQPLVWAQISELCEIARLGAVARPVRPAEVVSEEMRRIQTSPGGAEVDPRREERLAAELRSARQHEEAAGLMLDRALQLAGRLEETVDGLLLLRTEAADDTSAAAGTGLAALGEEIRSLRAGMAELAPSPPTRSSP